MRLGDKDVHVADMNGDGLPDIVRIRNGQVLYWPGRGNGTWGTGNRGDCFAGSFGSERAITMQNAPQLNSLESSEFFTSDVNGDGLTDFIKVRANAVDVYLNENGLGFTSRGVLSDTPVHPNSSRRVALTDINGSGTPDILWGNAEKFQYMDLTGGKKPGVLVQVSNGLGKTTTIEYATSTEQMLAAEGQAACPESGIAAGNDPWAYAWCKKMPTVAHVVSRVTESDNLVAAGQGPSKIVTEYDYRDPVYEGRQREFRGFERVRVRRLGDANSPTDVSESGFLLGECLDLTNDGTDDCSLAERWRDNPMEALKGLPFVSEKRDLAGRTLSTDVTSYELRKLYEGRDGRAVSHAVAVTTTSYAYDTSAAFTGGGSGTPAVVQFVKLGTGASAQQEASNPQTVISKPIATRSSTYATLQAASGVDFFGNQYLSTKFGCIANCADSAAGLAIQADEVIASYTIPAAVPLNATGWMFRTVESWTEGSLHGLNRYGYQKRSYDPQGNPWRVDAELVGSVGLTRSAGFVGGLFVASQTLYDDYGNPTRVTGANDRCSTLDYDPAYAQLPVKETVYRSAGCKDGLSVTAGPYDRGLGLVLLT
ncbi:MAG TPA: toxin TcdB middle/N-terminal domain-containing protein, partial [Polyangiaceae bacterium]|nr:toxin TcdB middle/N-terminal domain-containing protein [Polyangiaceae bacterium]